MQKILPPTSLGHSGYCRKLAHLINETSGEGYRVEKVWPILQEFQGSGTTVSENRYVQVLMNEDRPALYRLWHISDHKYQSLQSLIDVENRGGFFLTDIKPMDIFQKYFHDEPEMFTEGLILLFAHEMGKPGLRITSDICRVSRPDADTVMCPVKNCRTEVPNMMKDGVCHDDPGDADLSKYVCPDCGIIISPSAFEYTKPELNLLWRDEEDCELVEKIRKSGKANWSRMGYEKDEDSLTFNLFRYLERRDANTGSNVTGKFLDLLLSGKTSSFVFRAREAEIIYWATDTESLQRNELLDRVCRELGEEDMQTEPDIILNMKNGPLIFIDAHLSGSSCSPPQDMKSLRRYESHPEFSRFFNAEASKIAIDEKLYDHMRYWITGNLKAKERNRRFFHITITRDEVEKDLQEHFRRFITEPSHFIHITWSDVLDALEKMDDNHMENEILIRHLKERTTGYVQKDGWRVPQLLING